MIFKLINQARDKWYDSNNCTIRELINYMESKNEMRESQIDAIKTYLYLKIECQDKPLYDLFIDGKFNQDLDLSEVELKDKTKEVLRTNKSAMALYQYSLLTNEKGEKIFDSLNQEIRKNAKNINFRQAIKNMFNNVSYTDYLFSLPMGAGKTYLMAAFIYLDLYFAINEPNNKAFAHNFIVFAPSGLKSSVVPSLKTIRDFDASWVLPKEAVKQIKSILKFEILDELKTANKSNKVKNPNVQKVAAYQPFDNLMGLVMVTNAEKVILDNVKIKDKKTGQISFEDVNDSEKAMNELRKFISLVPNLQVMVDEVHHLADEDIKLNGVVRDWANKGKMNSLIGFSGTPFYNSNQVVSISDKFVYKTLQIPFIVNYYPLMKAVETFLKKPTIKYSENKDASYIIENGLKEFFDKYKDKKYGNGTCAKVAIYCGRIKKLREDVYTQCSTFVSKLGIDPDEAILCYHGADSEKKYTCSKEEKLEFSMLDDKTSKKRIILLAQIGREGWNCKSLTSVILSQEGDCPTNMVLQTTCRCLRQVDKDSTSETALIWLNEHNANILNQQLQTEQHTNIQEINNVSKKEHFTIKRYDRTKQLKLPTIDYFQLKVTYECKYTNDNRTIEEKLKAIKPVKKSIANRETNVKNGETKIIDFVDNYGNENITYSHWLIEIVKESFNLLVLKDLITYNDILSNLFNQITIKKNNYIYLNELFNNNIIKSEIRKAFQHSLDFETKEEFLGETKSLLNNENLTETIKTDDRTKFYPTQSEAEAILLADRRKSLYTPEQEKQIQILKDNGMEDLLVKFELPLELKNKDKTFHYLPYNFSQSNFEKETFRDILKLPIFNNLNLEIYYNGDRGLTEFKIKCYKLVNKAWYYCGMYTPDFLLIQRDNNKIKKALIIETKGSGFANDKNFNEKKEFVKSKFLEINKNKFDYFYVEDNENNTQAMQRLTTKIQMFFEEN